MLSNKKGIPQSKPFTMENLIDAANNYMKCFHMNCNQEMNIYYRNKYILEMERSIFDFRNNVKNGKADFTKFNNEIAKLKIKAMKEKEREMVVKCYLKKCHNETSRLLKLTIQKNINLLQNIKKY